MTIDIIGNAQDVYNFFESVPLEVWLRCAMSIFAFWRRRAAQAPNRTRLALTWIQTSSFALQPHHGLIHADLLVFVATITPGGPLMANLTWAERDILLSQIARSEGWAVNTLSVAKDIKGNPGVWRKTGVQLLLVCHLDTPYALTQMAIARAKSGAGRETFRKGRE